MAAYAVGIVIGLVIGSLLTFLYFRDQKSSGTIYVSETEEKTLYSLQLEDYPEELKFKKKVVFKVDHPENNLTRE